MGLRTARAAVFTDVSIPRTVQVGETHVWVSVQKKGREYTCGGLHALFSRVVNDGYLQRLSCLLRTSCDSPCLRTS